MPMWLFKRFLLCAGPTRVYLLDFLLQYLVWFAIGSLSLLCLLFIFWFVCSGIWCVGRLVVFHAGWEICVS